MNTYLDEKYFYWYREDGCIDQNFGDIIGPVLVEKLSCIKAIHISDSCKYIPRSFIQYYLTVGSIVNRAKRKSIVWGSGIIDSNSKINTMAEYLAVRGPITRSKILEKGGECPEVYGDPALLLPLLFSKKIKKAQKYTFVPHYVDYDFLVTSFLNNESDVDIIKMMTRDFEQTLNELSSSNLIISSSLHGLVISIAYGIPCLWVEFSDDIVGDDVKYFDFFASLGINNVTKHVIENLHDFMCLIENLDPIVVSVNSITNLQKQLLESYPFEINIDLEGVFCKAEGCLL